MPWLPKKCVVVPIDFSPCSPGAIATAFELVAKPSDVHVIHVLMGGSDRDLQHQWAPRRRETPGTGPGESISPITSKTTGSPDVVQVIRLGDPGSPSPITRGSSRRS